MAEKTWEISGEYMESCNCDYLCPCIFTNPQGEATHENCVALMVYRIDRGRHGDTVSGEAGGPPQMIRDNLVSDFRGVEFRDIGFTAEGLRRATDIPGILAFEIEGVASRNRSGEPFYIDNTAHPANRRLALARSRKTELQGFGLGLSLAGKGNNGHFAPFAWGA